MRRRTTGALLLALLSACGPAADGDYRPELGERSGPARPVYRIGIHPLHNPQRLLEIYGPIVDHINDAMPQVEIRLEASRSYEEYEKKLFAGHYAFAMPNPYQTVRALRHGYRVFAKMADDSLFRGLILVRRDGPIRGVQDLRGRSVSYPAPSALAATMLPQQFLQAHGLRVIQDLDNRYVGSQESSILAVLRGHVAAAATWPVPWQIFQEQHPQEAAQLKVKWQTDTLPNNAWVVRQDVAPADARQFAELLLRLHESEAGQAMLQRIPLDRFEPASEETYRPVRRFLEHFARTVRPIEY